MALPVHHGPLSITPPILLSLHRRSTAAQSPDPNFHSWRSSGLKLTTAILFGVVIITLFSLGFFTAYLRRCLRNRTTSSEAAVLAAVTAAAIATPPNRRRRGLDPTTIDSFPSIPFSSIQCIKPNKLRCGPECAICLSGFSNEEMLRLLPGCRHVFHAECIDTWLASHITCPVCRADLSDPIVAAAGQSLMADLADERCSDAVEIVVEMFHLDSDPDLDQQLDPVMHMAQPENVRQDLDLAKPHRRAASLVFFHGRSSAPLESLIRNVSVQRQIQADSDLGQRSSMRILQGTPRHSDPGQRPGKLFLPAGLHRFESRGSEAGDTSRRSGREVGPTGSQKEKNYAHYVSFTGFVINGDVAANDWLPDIFQVSTAVQSTPSN